MSKNSCLYQILCVLIGVTCGGWANTKTFTLWQLPSQSGGQMNSYVLQTVSGKLLVIDGGFAADADYLKGFLAALGNRVDLWFISHPDVDHVSALTAILEKPGDLEITAIYGSLPDEEWMRGYEPESLKTLTDFKAALAKSDMRVIELECGQVIECDGLTIKILGVRNPEIRENGINNSSVAMRVWDDCKSILFTGDLGPEGGQKLLKGEYKSWLKSDYVQMAHHGQNGVDETFYKAVRPTYCLWPTPLWLWNNDNGGGKGSGPWRTLEVREWMDNLGVQKHYVLFEGLIVIR